MIAKNTFREILRDRILYGLVIFALLLIGFSLALGQLSFDEQSRISLDFGMTGIQLSAVILSIFVGSTLVSREIEKRTILTLLARSVTRVQFLIGKFLGLTLITLTVMLGLAAVQSVVIFGMGAHLSVGFFVAMWGVCLEALLLLAITFFFGSFCKPLMTVISSMGMFLIGHFMNSLVFLTSKNPKGDFLRVLSHVLKWCLPNLEKFNWRSLPVYGEVIPASVIIRATLYAFFWVVLLMSATAIIFGGKDFA